MKLRAGRANFWGPDEHEVLDKPRAFVYRAATHNIAAPAAVPIQWDTKVYDTDGMWNSGGGATITPRLTCRTEGLYETTAWALWPSDANSYRQIYLMVNGGLTYCETTPTSALTITSSSINRQIALRAGDYVQTALAHNSPSGGGVLTLPVSGTSATYDHGMQMCLISTI